MDGGPNDAKLLLASAKQEIAALRGDPRFDEPSDGKRGAALWRHVLDLIEASELRMERVPDEDADASARQAFARSLRQSISVLRAAHRAIPWLAATKSPNVNLGSLYMSEEYAEILVGTDVDLVVVPDIEFMYSTVSWPFSAPIDTTPGFTRKTDRRPIILNYPLSDSDRLLLHPLFAHELGHATVTKFELIKKLDAEILSANDFSAALDDEVGHLHGTKFDAMSKPKLRQTIRAWFAQWVTELLCDRLAVESSGPAFLWAVAAFLLPLDYSEPLSTHPPTALRVKLILEQLEADGWREFCQESAPGITTWLEGVAADGAQSLEQPYEFLRAQVEANKHWLRGVVVERVEDGALKPDVVDQARAAGDLLDRLILPVGPSQDPLAPRAILLGGWLDGIRRHGDSPEGVVQAQSDRRQQNLVGKGIEMSIVAASWSNQ